MKRLLNLEVDSLDADTALYEFLMSLEDTAVGEGLLRRIFFYATNQHNVFNNYFDKLAKERPDLFFKLLPLAIPPIKKGSFNRDWFAKTNAFSLLKILLFSPKVQEMLPRLSMELKVPEVISLINQIDWAIKDSNPSPTIRAIQEKIYPKLGQRPRTEYEEIVKGLQIRSRNDVVLANPAMIQQVGDLSSLRGGIDLTRANMNLQTQNAGKGIRFHLDPAQLAQLKNAPGFVPVIVNIQPLGDLRTFLGLEEKSTTPSGTYLQ